jgi:hypothetical protein
MPITQAVHGGGTAPSTTQRVYYTGTDELLEGYALCYNFDASDVSAENLTLSAGVDEECPARRLQVEKPSVNNCVHFAGVVSNKHASGFTGPGWIEINMPGSICNIYAAASVDHGSTGTGMNTGQILTFDLDAYTFTHDGCIGSGSAIVLQDVDRSSTNGLVMAELCTGMPSGGVQTVNSTHFAAEQDVSVGGVLCMAPFGVTILPSTAFTANALTAALTTCLVAADAQWLGQYKEFRQTVSTGATGVQITASTALWPYSSTAPRVTTPAVLTTSIVTNLVTFNARWDGIAWVIGTNSSVATTAS